LLNEITSLNFLLRTFGWWGDGDEVVGEALGIRREKIVDAG